MKTYRSWNDRQFKANRGDNRHFTSPCITRPTSMKQRTMQQQKKKGNIKSCFHGVCPVKWLVYSGASITQLCHHASRPVSLSSWCAAACRWPPWMQSKAQLCFRLFFEWLLSVLNPFGSCFHAGKKITRFLSCEMHANIATNEIVNRQKWLNP